MAIMPDSWIRKKAIEEKMIKDYGKHFLYTLSWFTTEKVLDDPRYDEFL